VCAFSQLSRAAGAPSPLLFVPLDNRGGPDGCTVRILAELAARSPLPEKVPALIQLDSNLVETNLVVIRQGTLTVQPLLLVNERFNLPQDGFIRCVLRHTSPQYEI
jgi:hypothetical protein